MHRTNQDLTLIANTIRGLAMDGVQQANSGHPGMPMGCADIAAVLWGSVLRYNPDQPEWINRDRFVLSAGHGSMLLYSALHLAGYNISLDELKNFRQWGSKTPGHPEYHPSLGIETTTGPLGQGCANAVGMAIASSLLAQEFNRNKPVIDHYVYALMGDGDLMEGVSSEAASLAGHMGLANLIFIYDSNNITIEGKTELAFSEDMRKRFESYNWQVQEIDGHNYEQISQAITNAQAEKTRPSLIIAKTKIAKGSPTFECSEKSHGSPLGDEEIKKTKANLCCPADEKFCVPARVYDIFKERKAELAETYKKWQDDFTAGVTGDLKKKWDTYFTKPDITAIREKLVKFDPATKIATRSAGGKVLEGLFAAVPNLVGGSADLSPSTNTFVKGYSETGKNKVGRNMHFGIREHAMGSIQNGIAYYGGFIPYGSTFFVFMDYMRPPVRIAALSNLQSIFVFTHDSIFVGEDGPTHQPVEHLAAARAIPNLTVIRPADAEETREAWLAALANTTGPTAIILTRQNLPIIDRSSMPDYAVENLHKGAYVIWEAPNADVLVLASGSEVSLAIESAVALQKKGINCRVVSMASFELFEKQDSAYKNRILDPAMKKRVVIETGLSFGWERYAGMDGLYITMNGFGASAPQNVMAEKFGFTREQVVQKVSEFAAC